MGWTYTHAINYTDTGMVDRKAEIADLYTERYKIVKSVFVGSVCYVALKDTETGTIVADVVHTHTDNKDYFNFGYKAISETCGPCEDDCPASILNILSDTDDEDALDWRRRCRENIEKKKSPAALKNLAIGSTIKCTIGKKEFTLQKMAPNRQFKRAWWYIPGENKYMPYTRIPDEYEVISA